MGVGKWKVSFNSPVVLGFAFLCLAALVLSYLTGGLTNRLLFSVYRSSPLDPLGYVRLVGHVFGHEGWNHFFGNMTLILVVGPLLEEKHGSANMAAVILATAVVTGLVNCIFFPHTQLLGASGVVFAFILLASITSMREGRIPLTFILVAVIYLGGQVYEGIFVRDDISHLTHILGGAVGAFLGYRMNRNRMSG